MQILITGVAGFIGSNFVYNYLDNHPEDIIIGYDSSKKTLGVKVSTCSFEESQSDSP